jgi:D-amino-acid dehydrogenase
MMTKAAGSVLIIGGGVIAACSAYYLSKAGYVVTIVEKDTFGGGCSHANCGLICPSHALPLSVPGALMKPFKSMFNSSSPFYVNPLVGPSLWGWMMRFALNCNQRKSLAAAKARYALLESSMALFKELIQVESMNVEWHKKGLLFVHKDQTSFDHYSRTNDYLNKHFDLAAKKYDARAVVELEPALRESVVGGWYYDCDAHLRPDRLMAELKRILVEQGTKIIENCTVSKIHIGSGKAVGIDTNKGEMSFDNLILATGAMAPKLAKTLGVKLHIQPGTGYSLTTNHPDPCPKIPMILAERLVAVTPFDSGYRLGSTMEFRGYNDRINRKRLGLLEQGAQLYLREARGETIEEEWFGWRPMTDNGIPIIGQTPAISNAYIAAGHSMQGVSMGPGTGKLIAELIAGDKPHIDENHYRPV